MTFDPCSEGYSVPWDEMGSVLLEGRSSDDGESSFGFGYTNSVPTWNASGVRVKLEEHDGSYVIPHVAEEFVLRSCVKKEAERLLEKNIQDDDPPRRFREGKCRKDIESSGKRVELVVPGPEDRYHNPPPGCFTVFETYFDSCFLTFPIPSLILQFLAMYGLAMGQVAPRGLRTLVGTITLCLERGIEIGTWHLMTLFEVKACKVPLSYYVSPKQGKTLFVEHPSKEEPWKDYFFFVKVNPFSVDPWFISEMVTGWSKIGRPAVDAIPANLYKVWIALIAKGEIHWDSFSFKRAFKARSREKELCLFDYSTDPPKRMSKERSIVGQMREQEKAFIEAGNVAPQCEEVEEGEIPTAVDECPSTLDKGKGIALNDEKSPVKKKKKRRSKAPEFEFVAPDSVKDGNVAAPGELLGAFRPRGASTAPVGEFRKKKVFEKVARQGFEFLAQLTGMASGYEADSAQWESRIAESKKIADESAAEAARLKEEFEKAKVAHAEELDRVKAELLKEKKEWARRLLKASQQEKTLLVKKYRQRGDSARALVSQIEEAHEELILSEVVKANLDLYDLMQSGDQPEIASYKELLDDGKVRYADTRVNFQRMMETLKDYLVASPQAQTFSPVFGADSMRKAASEVGISNMSGSMEGDPGLEEFISSLAAEDRD
ncbi:uncharacterized protein At3g60930, chloroplastic-like [Eutrema salsugineum]|uniref:uncharacterized protein At3g60930, chloroplastic-like n=1 Tax=Eutrema salsugineum TaxID=72664 RepID=UPI000CED6A6E|nr:uncharacterized protein At3g60930, chloroplastic-like [Eutrema salsugineum]